MKARRLAHVAGTFRAWFARPAMLALCALRAVCTLCAAATTTAAIAQSPAAPAAGKATSTLLLTLLVPADDPRLERARLERGSPGHPGGPALDALKIGIAENPTQLEALGLRVELQVAEVADLAAARAAVARADKAATARSGSVAAFIADLPAATLLAAADATTSPLVNIGAAADRLRESDCRRQVLHLVPSERMRADALAQFLALRRWSQVLLLSGPSEDDRARAGAALAAIKRHGLKLVAHKPFKLSADPRERDLANPLLLTGPSVGSYDVVWVVDSDGEFAVSLPFRTAAPRPVVGDGGLAALAWSQHFERYGAPQVTRRLQRTAGRPMGAHDWLAWMAGKALVAAALKATEAGAGKLGAPAFAQALAESDLDGSKGITMGFRPWDGQLRQPLLLSDGQGVAAVAPAEGVLHPKNNLDTLGADAPERLCKARV